VANQEHARKSMGPKTNEGKENSRRTVRPEHAVHPTKLEKDRERLHQHAEEKAAHEAESSGSDGVAGASSRVESPAQNEANFSGANHSREPVYGASVSGSPRGNAGRTDAVEPVRCVVGRPAPAKTPLGEPIGAPGALRNEANSSEATHHDETPYDAPAAWSPTRTGRGGY
jgi:hypothetical protein